MSNKRIFLSKQQNIKWMSDKYSWTSLLIALNILFFHCEFGSAIIIQFNLPGTSSNSTINLQCNIIQDNDNVNIENNSELCKNASIDAIVTYRDETLVFKGDKYWRLVGNGIAPGYPQPISQKWPDLPKCINTAFTDNDDKYIYFFKGSKYWKYEGVDLKENFPRDIKKDFPGVPDNLQASLIWRGDNLLYLFKGNLYWAVDMSDTPYNVYDDKSIKEWSGIPGNLDAALPSYGSVTYFFKAGKYYKYDDKSQGIVAEDPPYPRRVASNWFGCPKVIKVIED